jgi:hypothetical protein
MEGPAGEARLVELLDSVRGFSRVVVVAALGDAQGMQGIPVRRRLLATPQRSVDLRCAALLALAKRAAGAAASDVLTARLDGPPAVARYAAIGLAGVGDERAWSQVHLRLTRQLDRARPTFQLPEVLPGCAAFEVLITALGVRRVPESAGAASPGRPAAVATARLSRHGCGCFGKVRTSAPSLVIAIVCSLWAVRQPVALRSVQPSASVTSSAVSAMTHGSNASSSPGRSLYPRPGRPVFETCGSWCIVDPTP